MRKRTIIYLISSLLIFAVTFVAALMVGRFVISPSDFFKAVFTEDTSLAMERSVITNLRLPRTIMAAIAGIALSVSGLLYQETFQNKLTSPDLLGVSGGSAVGAALAIILGLSATFVSVFSFAFGIIAVAITLLLAKLFKNGSTTILLLSGIIVGSLMSAILTIIKYLTPDDSVLSSITYWLMGSFSNSTMKDLIVFVPVVAISLCVLLPIRERINIVALGYEEAKTKGVNYSLYRYIIIGVATILTATSVAFCGIVSWVGLVIPHIVRLLVGRDVKKTMPLCVTFGAVFMVIADIVSRSFTSSEIPVSGATGFFGTIIFIAVLFINRRSYHEHPNK